MIALHDVGNHAGAFLEIHQCQHIGQIGVDGRGLRRLSDPTPTCGVYKGSHAGQHDIGPDGWTVPFCLDVTAFLKWGQENQITVRVLNTAQAGGIWKPVTLEVLKLGN